MSSTFARIAAEQAAEREALEKQAAERQDNESQYNRRELGERQDVAERQAVVTLRQLAAQMRTGNPEQPYLSDSFIKYIFSINYDGKSALRKNIDGKCDLIEIVNLVGKEGEAKTMELLEQNKGLPISDIIRKADIFVKARRRMFMDTTIELKEKKKIASIVKCPKCHSNEVETKTVQIRAGDEASTDKNICRKCNYKFSIN